MAGHAVKNPSASQPKLLDQVRSVIRTKHYGYRTEQNYVQRIRRFILFNKKAIQKKCERRKSINSSPTLLLNKGFLHRLRINYCEVDLAMKAKSFGAKWNRKNKVWELKYEAVQALGLTERIVDEDSNFPNIRKTKSRDSPQ